MTTRIRLYLILFLLTHSGQALALKDPHYWIWAGILPSDAPENSELLLYQGNFLNKRQNWKFEHKGIYPSPITGHKVQLVFRMHDLPNPFYVDEVIQKYMYDWKQHDVDIIGVQLDFDSPSAKLIEYAKFLQKLRKKLPNNIEYSITGLGAWLAETDVETLKALHSSVDYVTYQFYVGREPLRNPDKYINFLRKNQHPYKVGVLSKNDHIDGIEILTKSASYRGMAYFIQR